MKVADLDCQIPALRASRKEIDEGLAVRMSREVKAPSASDGGVI
jgi:hypothetical protein